MQIRNLEWKKQSGLLLDKNKCPDVLVCLSMDATTYAYQTVVDQSKVGSVKIIGAYENDEIIMAIQKKILDLIQSLVHLKSNF